ncbi:carbonic anhydrase 1 isoform X2 [Cydia pomonella]|uniref:carbonic anhydrase 1 isoform X2 n=1 Tax=Cydia pomonella TaxID=82600 RepID=UPI002ADD6F8B|nr:carbonic anhydrase 1 isoform X2 [Cydia pomonella]
MVFHVKFSTLCFIFLFINMIEGFGTTRDQTSQRANTLSDDQDDIQKQLDNEARDRLQFATITSKHNAKRDYNERKILKEWQRKDNVVARDCKSRDISSAYSTNGTSFSSLPLKEPRRMTVRVQLPVNRYQTKKSFLRSTRMDGNPTEQISRLRASQSPIAISLQKCPTWTSLDGLKFKGYWDNEGSGVLLNTGQTAYFTLETNTRPRLSGGPLMGEYIFEQMHFHWSVDDFTGCEHVLDGHGYAAECHFVHYNSKYESMEVAVGHADGLAVVGFLLEVVDAPNPKFDKLVEGLEAIQKRDQAVRVTAESLSWMERDDLREGSYVTYKGSLTTPPYTECVTWIIYQKPVEIGTEQLGLLRQLEGLDSKPIERNVRPTQRHPPGHSVIYVKQFKAKL